MTLPCATLDENERRGVCQSLRDLIQHGGNMDHKDRKNLMWKAISLIETPRSETAPLVAGDLAEQRKIHDTYAPVSSTRKIDPWVLYVEAFRAMFPGHSPIELSATALQEMVDRLAPVSATRRSSLPWSPEETARRFHEAYESFAPKFGYQTRPESAKPWAEVPEVNKALMIAVVRNVLIEQASGTSDETGEKNGV